MKRNKHIQLFEHFLLTEALEISVEGVKDGILFITINGHEYGYKELQDGDSIKDIMDHFKKILKYNTGRALAWLKKNTQLALGSKKNESEDLDVVYRYFLNEDASSQGFEKISIGLTYTSAKGNKMTIKDIYIDANSLVPETYVVYNYETVEGKKGEEQQRFTVFVDMLRGY